MKIFINGMDGVGAFVLYDPLLKSIKRAYPDAKIAISCWRITRDLVKSHPLIDVYFSYEDISGINGPEKRFHDYISRLAPFDCAIDLGNPPLSMRVIESSKAEKRIGLRRNSEEYNSFLTHSLPFLADRHMCRQYLDLLEFLDIEDREFSLPEVWISKEDAFNAFKKYGDKEFLQPGNFVLGVVVGAGSVYKRWPKGRFAEFIDLVNEKYRVKVLLFGTDLIRLSESRKKDARETEVASWIVENVSGPRPINLSRDLPLGELAVLIERCDLVISNDTGPMHIAAAEGTPVVGIFGPTSPVVWGPLGKRTATVEKDLECRPCTPAGCPDNVCLQSITPEEVLEAVSSLDLPIPLRREECEAREEEERRILFPSSRI